MVGLQSWVQKFWAGLPGRAQLFDWQSLLTLQLAPKAAFATEPPPVPPPEPEPPPLPAEVPPLPPVPPSWLSVPNSQPTNIDTTSACTMIRTTISRSE